MPRQYKKYTDEDIIREAANVYSLANLLRALNLKVAGGNYNNMKRKLQSLNVNCDHWHGQAWNKDQRLKDWSDYNRASYVKPHLIKDKGHQCEQCLKKTWNDQDIPLEIHHIDGDRTNNEIINLQLLCCNCHAQTHNWRRYKNE